MKWLEDLKKDIQDKKRAVTRAKRIARIKYYLKDNLNLTYMNKRFFICGGGFMTPFMLEDIKRRHDHPTPEEKAHDEKVVAYLKTLTEECGGVNIDVCYPAATWDGFNVTDFGKEGDIYEKENFISDLF